jgi:hypothetical protein
VDQMIAGMQSHSGLGMPGTDLILANAFDELMATTTEGKHIGQGVIDGVECEHLAFRTPDTDWQIWIEPGAKPVPRKYVITSKTLTGAPQYTLRIRDWKTDAFTDADTFVFKAPAGATKIDLDAAAVADFDELPPVHRQESRNEQITNDLHVCRRRRYLRHRDVVEWRGSCGRERLLLRSGGPGRKAAHAHELCRSRPADDAPRGGRRRGGRCGRRVLWILLRAGG